MSNSTDQTRGLGFLLTRHAWDRSCSADVILWIWTEAGARQLIVHGQEPTLFISRLVEDEALATLNARSVACRARHVNLRDFSDQPVTAVYFPTLRAFRVGKQSLLDVGIAPLEHDIRLEDRYLMERFVRGALEYRGVPGPNGEVHHASIRPADITPNFRVISLDIECSMQGELFSIGLHGAQLERVLMVGDPAPCKELPFDLIYVPDERALLTELERQIDSFDPDIIIGWNVVHFDFELLYRRAKQLGTKLTIGRGGGQLHYRKATRPGQQGFVTLPGRVIVDGIAALKTATYRFEDFSLETVAQELLNRGKKAEDVYDRVKEIEHNFHHNKKQLAEYNLEDCRLVSEIFADTRLLDFLRLRSQLTGLELDRQGGSVAAFTNLYLPRLHRAGFVAPDAPGPGAPDSPGGYVMDSRPGLYRNVLVLDFKSLYPSIIRTFLVDPLGLILGLKSPDDAVPGFRGAAFSREQHFLPQILTKLWAERDEAKRLNDGPRSQAIKILMNSFYGVLGAGICRFYDHRLASSITMRGHQVMRETATWVEEAGHAVIYGDTDSLFVWLEGDVSEQRARRVGSDLAQAINEWWRQRLKDEFDLPCYLEMEFETHFRRFLMPTIRGSEAGSKKRYAGLVGKGDSERLVFKGLETVRTDWTELARTFQSYLYDAVFHDQDPTPLVKETVRATRAGECDHQLIYHKKLRRSLDAYVKNVPPHVRAARLAEERDRKLGRTVTFEQRNSIAYVVTVTGPQPTSCVTSALDYEHYVERQIKPIADAILPLVDLDFDALTGRQMGLF